MAICIFLVLVECLVAPDETNTKGDCRWHVQGEQETSNRRKTEHGLFASVPSAGISIEARLKRLQRLSRQGLVTDAEFAELRRKMLAML